MTQTTKRVRLYIAEEQQLLREAYQSFFLPCADIEVVGTSGETDGEALARAASALSPNVLLVGIKVLQPRVVERMAVLRDSCPGVAIVLLSAYYDVKGITALREFSKGGGVGCAYLLKHTIDTVEQLTQVVYSVAEGRIIVDPAVMEGLISTSESRTNYLKDLSPRELEVLSWIAKGYRNNTIAEVLCLEPKTVERHINSIYSKLGTFPESKHARVHSVTLYLRATGQLPAEDFAED
ncbi:MAG: response regulator transcription factor [Dehalococcoidia bacterium]